LWAEEKKEMTQSRELDLEFRLWWIMLALKEMQEKVEGSRIKSSLKMLEHFAREGLKK
jgi:hypothetical protein